MFSTTIVIFLDRPLSGLSSSSIDSISQCKDQFTLTETEEKEKISEVILEEQPASEESRDMSDSRLATPSRKHTLTMVSPSSTLLDTPVMTPSDSRETFGTCERFSVDASSSPCTDLVQRKPVQKADRKSTRLNSSHANISYAVFCLKKKNTNLLTILIP